MFLLCPCTFSQRVVASILPIALLVLIRAIVVWPQMTGRLVVMVEVCFSKRQTGNNQKRGESRFKILLAWGEWTTYCHDCVIIGTVYHCVIISRQCKTKKPPAVYVYIFFCIYYLCQCNIYLKHRLEVHFAGTGLVRTSTCDLTIERHNSRY